MSYENVLLEEREEGIYLLTVNRPKVLNALSVRTVEEIGAAAAEAASRPGARALLITGAGDRAFVAGADIRELQTLDVVGAKTFSNRTHQVFRSLAQLPVPVIAVVQGYCLGGGFELALSCDWIVAGEGAVFGLPEVSLGVLPGAGGTQRLTRIVGPAKALELITTGRQVKAAEAKEWGLVNHVVPGETLLEDALKLARQVASRGPVAVCLAKEAVLRGQDLDLDNACSLESDVFALCFATDDRREGMAAFVEKRPPQFSGR
ncbi:MAG: enoyl-CoA hydratase-related protein [Deferrisomatales bacterium]